MAMGSLLKMMCLHTFLSICPCLAEVFICLREILGLIIKRMKGEEERRKRRRRRRGICSSYYKLVKGM
jgi:hypothetical protein